MLIDKLLASAIRLWLKSQVSTTDNLSIKIASQDRKIVRGIIPKVFIGATNTIYQGLHFSKLEIIGNNIKVNLPQVIKRKPLQLLEPVVINLQALLQAKDLQNSLDSPLLKAGLTDIWHRFLLLNKISLELERVDYKWDRLLLLDSGISWTGKYLQQDGKFASINMVTNIELDNAHSLILSPLKIITVPELLLNINKKLVLDLGTQVAIDSFNLNPEYLSIKGTITVFPG
jgi:hypothetical protein